MLEMLLNLTENQCTCKPEQLAEVIYNGAEVAEAIDLSDCVEVFKANSQEILIYGIGEDSRKYVKYSCSVTEIYDQLVISSVWGRDEEVYHYDYDKIYNSMQNDGDFMRKYMLDYTYREALNSLDCAENSLDEMHYGELKAHSDYKFYMGCFYTYREMVWVLDEDKGIQLDTETDERIDKVDSKAAEIECRCIWKVK